MFLQDLVKFSHEKKIAPEMQSQVKTPEYSVPVLGTGLKEVSYISQDTRSKIYKVFADDEALVLSAYGDMKLNYYENLSAVAPNEATYILQNLAPELLNFKYLYYRLLALEGKFNNMQYPSKKFPIEELKKILIGWYL